MATKKAKTNAVKTYTVMVKGNSNFVGMGAGGVQFANGKAENVNERMANWFKEHPGYEVIENTEVADDAGAEEKTAE